MLERIFLGVEKIYSVSKSVTGWRDRNCCYFGAVARTLLKRLADALYLHLVGKEIEKLKYRVRFEILDNCVISQLLMTPTSHLTSLCITFHCFLYVWRGKWKNGAAFLSETALMDAKTYRKRVLEVFWENGVKSVKKIKKEYSLEKVFGNIWRR